MLLAHWISEFGSLFTSLSDFFGWNFSDTVFTTLSDDLTLMISSFKFMSCIEWLKNCWVGFVGENTLTLSHKKILHGKS